MSCGFFLNYKAENKPVNKLELRKLEQKINNSKYISKVFGLLGRYKNYYVVSALLLIIAMFFRTVAPKIFQVVIDTLYSSSGSNREQSTIEIDKIASTIKNFAPELTAANVVKVLLVLAVIYMVVAFVRSALVFSANALNAKFTENAIKNLRDRLFKHIQLLPMSYHTSQPKGELIQRCTGDVDTIRRFILNDVVELVRMNAIFIFSFFMMWIVLPKYALITIALIPIVAITSYIFFRKEGKIWLAHEDEADKLTGITEENLSGIRVVKAFAKEDQEIEKFDKQNKAKLKIGLKHMMLHANFWTFSDGLIHLQFAISVLAGGYFTLTQQITVGELISFYTYAWMVTWPLRAVGRIMSRMGMAAVAMQRISTILEKKIEDYAGDKVESLRGEVEFKEVSFKYQEEEVLSNVSFKINAGESVAIIGPTGAGKSTIIALLNRFYEPTKGAIFIDGKDLKTYDKAFIRSKIGVVLQKAFLFSTSIKNNIAYTADKINEDEILDAATTASINEIMDVFNDGYETLVGEKGVTLSGGQKQRVALARTLLNDPDILVLDDSTSAVDTETEFTIQGRLKNYINNKTTIIIAHRVTSIQNADKIIVLEKGRVKEIGSHESLMDNGGFYDKILELQTGIEATILQDIKKEG